MRFRRTYVILYIIIIIIVIAFYSPNSLFAGDGPRSVRVRRNRTDAAAATILPSPRWSRKVINIFFFFFLQFYMYTPLGTKHHTDIIMIMYVLLLVYCSACRDDSVVKRRACMFSAIFAQSAVSQHPCTAVITLSKRSEGRAQRQTHTSAVPPTYPPTNYTF